MYYRNFTQKKTLWMSDGDNSVGSLECNKICGVELFARESLRLLAGGRWLHKGHFLKLVYGTFTLPPALLGIFTQNMFGLGKF